MGRLNWWLSPTYNCYNWCSTPKRFRVAFAVRELTLKAAAGMGADLEILATAGLETAQRCEGVV